MTLHTYVEEIGQALAPFGIDVREVTLNAKGQVQIVGERTEHKPGPKVAPGLPTPRRAAQAECAHVWVEDRELSNDTDVETCRSCGAQRRWDEVRSEWLVVS